MAREPELSIKVKVDPQINKAKLEEDVRAQVSNIKKLPAVPITPDISNLQDEIEKGLGGPYSVDIEPNLKKNLTQQINDEITAAQNGAQQIKVKLDVKEFGNDLSKQLKEQLRGVNRTLSNYLKEMQTNLALANKATYGLFGGGNRDVTVDSIFNEISKKDIKKAKVLSGQLGSIYSEFPNLLKLDKLKDTSNIKSVEELSSALLGLGHSLDEINDAVGNEDQTAYEKALSNFNSFYAGIKSSIEQISALTKDSNFLKSIGIDKGNLLKNFVSDVNTGLDSVKGLKLAPKDVLGFDASKYELEDIDDLSAYALDFIRYNDQIVTSAQNTKKELESANKSTQNSIGTGVPIDPSILDANTKKIIQSIGEVSAAMDDLESKSKNFSDNLTVEVDKHVSNIEEKVKQLKALVDVLPNGQKNIPEDSKGTVEPKDAASGTENGLSSVSIQGKVVITDADISVDVKDPVQIPGVVVVDSDGVQFGNTEELQKNVDSITSAKKALQSVVNKTENYVSEIAELGPAFQYVAQEVDNLSHSLENQIADFTRISELTNNYLDKSGSIKIDTSTVAVTGEPAAIDGKVVLSADDIVTPETPVDIKGHVTLEAADITPPKTPVEVKGKIVTTTTDTETKGKKKKSQNDIEKQELIELKGHIKLEDKDVERPDPIVMNGKVTVTKDNIKLPEGGIDVKGNLILKNAEIANAIRNASEKASNPKDTTKTASTNRKSSTSRRGLISDLITVNKKIAETKNLLDDVSEVEVSTIQKCLENLRANRDEIVKATAGTEEYNNAVKAAEDNWKNVMIAINSSKKAENDLVSAVDVIRKRFALLKEEVSQSSNDELKDEITKIEKQAAELASKNPAEYDNYASDLLALKQNTYSVQAKHTLWRKGYKGLEKKGDKIAQGVEIARQMQQDGTLKDADFKNIDELIAKLNKLPAQTDEYAKTLEEIIPIWEEIKKKVDAVNDAENKAIKQASARIAGASAVNKAMDSNQSLIGKVKSNNGTDKNFYSQLKEKQDKLSNLLTSVEGETDPVQAAKT